MEQEALVELRKVLATLYYDDASIRRIITDAGIDPARVSFNAAAINIWHYALDEARKIERLSALLTVVENEYRDNVRFGEICRIWRNLLESKEHIRSQASLHPQREIPRRRPINQTPGDGNKNTSQRTNVRVLTPSNSAAFKNGDPIAQFTAVYRHEEAFSAEYQPIYYNGQHMGDYGLCISPNNEKVILQHLRKKQVVVLEVWLEEFANHKATRQPHILLTIDENTKNRVYTQNPTTKRVKMRVAKQGLQDTVKGHRLALNCAIKRVALMPIGDQKLIARNPSSSPATFQTVEVELTIWYKE